MIELKFWALPSGSIAYEVDLTEFALGGRCELRPAKAAAIWAGDFRGRHGFAHDIANLYRLKPPPKFLSQNYLYIYRNLLRFLDEIDPDCLVMSCLDLNDGHGVLLRRWVEHRGLASQAYRSLRAKVYLLREIRSGSVLFWPVVTRNAPIWVEDFDEKGFQRLYTALKREAMSIQSMFREGRALAEAGEDPRYSDAERPWSKQENHAHIVEAFTADRIPYKPVFVDAGCTPLMKDNGQGVCLGPSYIAPGMTERALRGLVGKLRWFHPSFYDTAIFLWLFLIGTGWNLATALAIDVTDETLWLEHHPLDPGTVVIHAFKERADRHVFALSLRKPAWHPYMVLRTIIDRTAVMRATVRGHLEAAQEEYGRNPSEANSAEVTRLSTVVRSPWLYHSMTKVGEIGAIQSWASSSLNRMVRIVVERHGLAEQHPFLVNMVTTDARDAWIGHAYAISGHNALIARMAAQHGGLRTLRHYLRRRRYRAQSEVAIRRVQNAAFDQIERGVVLDPTRVRLLVERGAITPEQERRLLDRRNRTRVGMGCLDPRHPPREVAPDHVAGNLCRVQRCTGCEHGLVFVDSLRPLARAHAELIHIKRTIPLTSWLGSSFEEEERSIALTLERFDKTTVDLERDAWADRLMKGDILPHDTYAG